MSRLPRFLPADLDPEQTALHGVIAGGPRAAGPQLFRLTDDAGSLEGPFNAFLLQPALGSALQALGSAVRYETKLDARIREIAILVVAAHWDSAFERHAHEAVARSLDLTDADLAGLRDGRYDGLGSDERLVAETVAALADGGDLDDAAYDRFVGQFGRPAMFELLTLVGYYSTLALQLRVFRVAPPA